MIPAYERWWAENYNSTTSSLWGENIWQAATAAERAQCIAECEALAQKWFAEERRSWGMAAGECAAELESAAAIREVDDEL